MTDQFEGLPGVDHYREFNALPGIHIAFHGELLAVDIDNQSASARVFLQGAQVSHYRRHGEPPVLWCSDQCDYREGTPLRGGIPLCWPWFGVLDKNPAAISRQVVGGDRPAHGLVRNRVWHLAGIEQPSPALTRLILTLSVTPENGWNAPASLTLVVEIGDRLGLDLYVTNDGPEAFYFSAALHSYYAVSAIDRVRVQGLERLNYIDCVDGWTTRRQRGDLAIAAETDRIYHGTWQPLTLVDRGWRRALVISSEGSDSAVIWNPWIDKSRRLPQFADAAYKDMLCIETANAGDDCVVLEPGQQHRLGFSVRSRPLS